MTLTPTPGQTVGPFYGYALPYPGDDELVPAGHPGAIRLHGTVYDGAGQPIPDALIEIWHADGDGRIPGPKGRSAVTAGRSPASVAQRSTGPATTPSPPSSPGRPTRAHRRSSR
jgi:protocatechuate 3,4-dioxygenase alpha subunit